MKCVSCEYGGKHCMGTYPGCICECAAHTLDDDDPRMHVIALLTAEAHEDPALLMGVLAELPEDELREAMLVLVKYVGWILRSADIDPVAMIQKTALYWAGGEPEEDDDLD